ncbi:DNA repair protein RadC [Verrucomicrobiaceae bacterium 5K15]|uniref:DNA repair protein RadC n=1 Tax=Oceaniferula flava TaxID=2800421 RepID=A0AAE2SBQ7_9BACT|nr:DNA repair protein RadC [Oceaniferula flavus]MBK1854809.1 DNA repair protein RadC [Oceaniferula flavus]MBM1136115.1 DNA repair protein RadC [Oceaniferula flavus]
MAKIPDLPENERPRERLARLGAASISDAELLAIFLRVGVKGTSAIELGRQLLKKHGSLTDLGGLSVKELSKEHGLGPAKAAQLLAAFELGARSANEKMRRAPMNSADAIYEAVAPRLAHERKEHVLIVLLDTKLRGVRTIELSKGNTDTALCEPRDIMHHVLLNQSPAFVLVHNHPSGDPSPSRADIALTRRVTEAAQLMRIRFVDHLIVGRPSDDRAVGYHSFATEGMM